MRWMKCLARTSSAVLWLALLASASCSEPRPRTQVIVELDGDLLVRRASREIEIRAWGGPRGVETPSENMQEYRFDIEAVGGWPITHALLPENDDASRLFRVEAQIYHEDDRTTPIATVRAVSGYVEGRTLFLRLRFYAACLYVDPCESPDESCGEDGNCGPAWQPPDSLDDYDPDSDGGMAMPVCTSDLDCADTVDCTTDRCLPDGSCVSLLDDTLCTAGAEGRCDPEHGCQYGAGCTPATCAPTPCELSATCSGDVCERVPRCLIGQPCCGGMCGTCNDGNACTDDTCDQTAGECVMTPNGAACDDGVHCNGSDSCAGGGCSSHAGDPCTAPLVCDETADGCTGCTSDATCPPRAPMNGTCSRVGTNPCSTAGTMIVTTYVPRCTTGSCGHEAMMASASCTVAAADPCGSTAGAWGPCVHDPPSDICGTDGLESRMTMSLRCSGTSCTSPGTPGIESRWCLATPDPSCSDAGSPCGCSTTLCEMPEYTCWDGEDNDCDGAVDCADGDCFGVGSCFDGGMGDSCPPNEYDCSNGADDDCDMDTDCADPDCVGHPSCFDAGMGDACPPNEYDCSNGADDDCDMDTDCDDPDCVGHPSCFDAGMGDAGGACSSYAEFVCNSPTFSQCTATCGIRTIQCNSGVCTCAQGAMISAPCDLSVLGPRCASCSDAFSECCPW
jgi:hypothetical protein